MLRRLTATIFVLMFTATAAAQHAPEHKLAPPSMTVTGQATVTAKPDRAVVRLGAMAEAEDAARAQEQVSTIMQEAIAALEDLDIAKENVTTVGLSLTPVYESIGPDERPRRPRIVAYRGSNTLRIVVDDLDRVGPVIDAGVELGANNIESVTFELRDEGPHRQRALQQAVLQAQGKAKAMAQALDVELAAVAEVHEQAFHVMPMHAQRMGVAEMHADIATPIEPGQVEIQASVLVRYHLMTGTAAVSDEQELNGQPTSVEQPSQ